MRFLVTAGNTRERIDKVRDWGNIFTGNTGKAIAEALAAVGEVDLLTSNSDHLRELSGSGRIRASGFASHGELRGALAALLARERYDGVFMTAAVADYLPAGAWSIVSREEIPNLVADSRRPRRERWIVEDVQAEKVKGTHAEIAFLGHPTEKLIDLFRNEWGYHGLLVKFKLEVGIGIDELLKIGEKSRQQSGADYLVANTLDMVTGPDAGAYLIGRGGAEFIARTVLPARLARLAGENRPKH